MNASAGARRALVTGGSSGIGLATGRLLVERGYDVVLSARRAAVLHEAADRIGARAVPADAGDADEVARLLAEVEAVDLVVHAAGTMAGTFVRKESIEVVDAVLRANLRSAFLIANAALARMSPGGRIVFVSSSSSHSPQPGLAAYSASKAGLNAFAAALSAEVERDGIAVHTVTPAPVATPMLDAVRFPMHALESEQVADAIAWLDSLDPSVVLPEIRLRAVAVGPFAPELHVSPAAAALGRTSVDGTAMGGPS